MLSIRFIRSLIAVLLLLAGGAVAAAVEPPGDPFSREAMDAQLAKAGQLEKRLQSLDLTDGNQKELAALQGDASALRKVARDCIDQKTAVLDRVIADLEKLGETVEGEDPAVTSGRKKLNDDKGALDQNISTCKLLLVQAEALVDAVERELTALKARELTARFPGVIGVLTATPETLEDMQPLVRHHEHDLAWPRLAVQWQLGFGVVLLIGLGLIPVLQRLLPPSGGSPPAGDEFTRAMTFAFNRAVRRFLGPLVVLVLVTGFWLVVASRHGVVVPELGMSASLLAFVLLVVAGRTFLSPIAPAAYFLPFDEAASRRFWKAVRFLGIVWASAAFLYYATFIQLPLAAALQLRFAYTALFAFALGAVVWQFFELSARRGFGLVRLLVLLVLLAAVAAEFIGFRNLSAFLIRGVLFSIGTIAFAWLASRLIGDFLESIEEARYGWQKRFHGWVGVREGGYLPGVFWLRLATTLAIWLAAIWAFVGIWGVPEAVRSDVVAYATEGFQIGEVTVVPSRILIAVVVLAVLFSGISWLRKQLDENWLRKSRADVGARNAMSTITAYLGVTLAILLALSVAGVDLSNLAIIAGALSVGIGFGLQNIVNNFVSGLILLFERPIKQGDWIVVGTTEGYVRKISVRSTQIQTFDNADVIVPNSELISTQVTNWMLRDSRGRVRVPVGVAYGTDVQRVKEILLGIAMAHPQTVVDSSASRPIVLFMSFGDSAINLELRFFIRNVDYRLSVRSDIYFAIDKAFREEGVVIPFPQRDIHVQQVPPPPGPAGPALRNGDSDEDDDAEPDGGPPAH